MSEEKYESKITSSSSSAKVVYESLGNLSNIERVRHLIPEDKISDIEIEEDAIRFKVDGLGQKVQVRLVDRKENDTLKFLIDSAVVQANLWIQMKQVKEGDTRLKLTLKSNIPTMFKMMLGRKVQDGIDQAADMLAQMPFDKWSDDTKIENS